MKYGKTMVATAAFSFMLAAFAEPVVRTDDFDGVDTTSSSSCIIDCSKHATWVDASPSQSAQTIDSLISTWMESAAIFLRTTLPRGFILLVH